MDRHPIGCDPADFTSVPTSALLRQQATERRKPSRISPPIGRTTSSAAMDERSHVQVARDFSRAPSHQGYAPSRSLGTSPPNLSSTSRHERMRQDDRGGPSDEPRRHRLIDPMIAQLGNLEEIFDEINHAIPNRKTATGLTTYNAACNRLMYSFVRHVEDVQEAMQLEREKQHQRVQERRERAAEAERAAITSAARRRRRTTHSPVRVQRHEVSRHSWPASNSRRVPSPPPPPPSLPRSNSPVLHHQRRSTHSPTTPRSRRTASPSSRHRNTYSAEPLSRRTYSPSRYRRDAASPPFHTSRVVSPKLYGRQALSSTLNRLHSPSPPHKRRRSSPSTFEQHPAPSPKRRKRHSSTFKRDTTRNTLPSGYMGLTPSPSHDDLERSSSLYRHSNTSPPHRTKKQSYREQLAASQSQPCEPTNRATVLSSSQSRKARMSEPVRRATPPSSQRIPSPQESELQPLQLWESDDEPSVRPSRVRQHRESAQKTKSPRSRNMVITRPSVDEDLDLECMKNTDPPSLAVDLPPPNPPEDMGAVADVEPLEDDSDYFSDDDDSIQLPIVRPRPYVYSRSLVSDFTSITPIIYDEDDGTSTEEERRANARRIRPRALQGDSLDAAEQAIIHEFLGRAYKRRLRVDSVYDMNAVYEMARVFPMEPIDFSSSASDHALAEIAMKYNINPFRHEDLDELYTTRRPPRRGRQPGKRSTARPADPPLQKDVNVDMMNGPNAMSLSPKDKPATGKTHVPEEVSRHNATHWNTGTDELGQNLLRGSLTNMTTKIELGKNNPEQKILPPNQHTKGNILDPQGPSSEACLQNVDKIDGSKAADSNLVDGTNGNVDDPAGSITREGQPDTPDDNGKKNVEQANGRFNTSETLSANGPKEAGKHLDKLNAVTEDKISSRQGKEGIALPETKKPLRAGKPAKSVIVMTDVAKETNNQQATISAKQRGGCENDRASETSAEAAGDEQQSGKRKRHRENEKINGLVKIRKQKSMTETVMDLKEDKTCKTELEDGELSYDYLIDATGVSVRTGRSIQTVEESRNLKTALNLEESHGRQVSRSVNVDEGEIVDQDLEETNQKLAHMADAYRKMAEQGLESGHVNGLIGNDRSSGVDVVAETDKEAKIQEGLRIPVAQNGISDRIDVGTVNMIDVTVKETLQGTVPLMHNSSQRGISSQHEIHVDATRIMPMAWGVGGQEWAGSMPVQPNGMPGMVMNPGGIPVNNVVPMGPDVNQPIMMMMGGPILPTNGMSTMMGMPDVTMGNPVDMGKHTAGFPCMRQMSAFNGANGGHQVAVPVGMAGMPRVEQMHHQHMAQQTQAGVPPSGFGMFATPMTGGMVNGNLNMNGMNGGRIAAEMMIDGNANMANGKR